MPLVRAREEHMTLHLPQPHQTLAKAVKQAAERRNLNEWALTLATAAMLRMGMSVPDVRQWLKMS